MSRRFIQSTSRILAVVILALTIYSPNYGGTLIYASEDIIQNGGFEAESVAPWQFWWGTNSQMGDPHSGQHALSSVGQGGGAQPLALEANKTYKLSVWGKSNGRIDIGLKIKHNYQTESADALDYEPSIVTFTTNEYSLKTATFTVPDTILTSLLFFYNDNGSASVDDVSLELIEEETEQPELPEEPSDGENLVLNAGFEDASAAPWQFWWGNNSQTGEPYSGEKALRSEGQGGGAQPVTLQPNATYKLSARGKSTGRIDVGLKLKHSYQEESADALDFAPSVLTFNSDTYALNTSTFTVPSTMTASLLFFYNDSGVATVDDVRLEQVETEEATLPVIPPPSAPSGQAPTMAGGNFSLSGSTILDPSGEPFVVKGVNANGPRWPWSRSTLQDIEVIADLWKFNTVRLNAFPRMEYHGVPEHNGNLDELIDWYTKKGLVIMIENHDSTGVYPKAEAQLIPDPMSSSGTIVRIPSLDEVTAWWVDKANRYKDNPYVWFNLLNEPGMGGLSNDDSIQRWKEVHDHVAEAIRDTGAQNMIVLDEHSFGQGNGYVRGDADSAVLSEGDYFAGKYDNVIFSLHMYELWDQGETRLHQYVQSAQSKNLPIIIGEYADSGSSSLRSATEAMFNVAIPNGVGRIVWSWDNVADSMLRLTNGNTFGAGWEINRLDERKPSNLTWMGSMIWDDNHDLFVNKGMDAAVSEVVVSDTSFQQGDSIRLGAEIRLLGSRNWTAEDSVQVVFNVNGVQIGSSKSVAGPLKIGETLSVLSDPFSAPGTSITIEAVIESMGPGLEDENETNDTLAANVVGVPAAASADLVIDRIVYGNGEPLTPGASTRFAATIRNAGTQALSNELVRIAFTAGGQPVGWANAMMTLQPGESREVASLVDWKVTLEHSFHVSAVVETREDLNDGNDKLFTSVDFVSEPQNLVMNGGFEAGLSGWANWSNLQLISGGGLVHNGEQSLKVGSGGEHGDGGGQLFGLMPNTTYVLSGWGKNEEELSEGLSSDIGYQYTVNGTEIKHILSFTHDEYEYKQLTFTTPSAFTNGRLFVWKSSNVAGPFYADDITLKEVRSVVVNGGFEDDLEGWSNWSGISVTTDEAISGEKSLFVGSAGQHGDGGGQLFNLEPNTAYTISAWGKHVGDVSSSNPTDIGYQYTVDGEEVKYFLHFTEEEWTRKQLTFITPASFTNGRLFVWKHADTNVDFYADDIVLSKAGSLVVNGGAEEGMNGWSNWSQLSLSTNAAAIGTSSLKVGSEGEYGDGGGQLFNVKPNSTYILSAWGRNAEQAAPSISSDIGYQYTVDGVEVKHILRFTEGDWEQKQLMFTTPDTFTEGRLFIWKHKDLDFDFFADNIVLVEAPSVAYEAGISESADPVDPSDPVGPVQPPSTNSGSMIRVPVPAGAPAELIQGLELIYAAWNSASGPVERQLSFQRGSAKLLSVLNRYEAERGAGETAVVDSDEIAQRMADLKVAFDVLSELAARNGLQPGLSFRIQLVVPDGASELVMPASLNELARENGIERIEVNVKGILVEWSPDTMSEAELGSAENLRFAADILSKKAVRKQLGSLADKLGERPIYDLTLFADGKEIKTFNPEAPMRITVPYELAEGESADTIIVYYIGEQGAIRKITDDIQYEAEASKLSFTAYHFSKYMADANRTFNEFMDIGGLDAHSQAAIEEMALAGVIRGKSEHAFMPQEAISRAEFVAMIVRLFDLDTSNTALFKDVSSDAWYADAVGAARKAGIVLGNERGEFKPDERVSRQDMAVILLRAMDAKGFAISAQNQNPPLFEDESAIADYAKEQVSKLSAAGLMTGIGQGEFAPLASAKRKDVAVLLHRVYQSGEFKG
jgi:hypothetical protein